MDAQEKIIMKVVNVLLQPFLSDYQTFGINKWKNNGALIEESINSVNSLN